MPHKKRKTDKVTIDYKAKNFKNHIKGTDKVNARYFCIIGSNELQSGTIIVKDLEEKTEKSLTIEEF